MAVTVPAIPITQGNQTFLQVRMLAADLTAISYAAVRGIDDETGAVQRFLNTRRIASIKDFFLAGGDLPTNIILNWSGGEAFTADRENFTFEPTPRTAQIIDGQHRVAGLRAAIEERRDLGNLQVPVAVFSGLSTQQCADIFLSINTEQKPVARSLVFDLYGLATADLVDSTAVRAKDIVLDLNSNSNSPYKDYFKFPGAPRTRGGIALSTAVTELKPLLEPKGDFDQLGISELELQIQILTNFWAALASKYGDEWQSTQNAFLFAAGFSGGIEFFRKRLIPYCNKQRSFSKDLFLNVIGLSKDDLILQSEVKGLGGRDAPRVVFERLDSYFNPEVEELANFTL
ncbi:DGQHR domain-containing protein [Sphingomonas faeni]|uniref:DGQHR domain-containing protein n=1 Tax=Sphingomonas faeni TaxID=185950 RepID=UPI003349D912